jgi:hypothetical protein
MRSACLIKERANALFFTAHKTSMAVLKGRDLLSLADLNPQEVELLQLAAQLKSGS